MIAFFCIAINFDSIPFPLTMLLYMYYPLFRKIIFGLIRVKVGFFFKLFCFILEGDNGGSSSNDSPELSNGRGPTLIQAGPDELPPPYPSMTGTRFSLLFSIRL